MIVSGRAKRALTTAEIVILGPVAAIVVLGIVPATFGIEWFCVFEGAEAKGADYYWDTFSIVTPVTWLALVVAAISTHTRGLRNVAAALPVVWFVLLVASSFVVGASLGSQPCGTVNGFIF